MPQIVVFGATGYAGDLAVEALTRRGLHPVLAGRNEESVRSAAERHGGLEHRLADVTDPDSVRALIEPGDVLVTTVGPFDRFGWAAGRAAAEVGAHYVDSTGEVGFVRELRNRYDQTARDNDAIMVPAFGNDYVPGIFAGSMATEEAGTTADSLDIAYFATGPLERGLSHGTRVTAGQGLVLPVTVRRDGRLFERRAAQSVGTFEVRGERKQAVLATGTEVVFLPERYPKLDNVAVYNGWFPELARAMQALAAVTTVASRLPYGRTVFDAVNSRMAGRPGGPDAKERKRTKTHVVAVARSGAGETLAEVHVEGPNMYTLTAELMAEAAERLSRGSGRGPGVVGPIEAFGASEFRDLCAAVKLTRVS